jgi:glycosyltransferase involved in cell wall biosynthesis
MNSYVSFIIPTIGRQVLKRAIDSILAQTDKDFKIIVVSDGVDIDFENCDEKISYLKSPLTKSPGLTRNFAFPYVQSKWIGFVDDDDLIYERYIEELKKEDEKSPDISFVLFRMLSTRITPRLDIKKQIKLNEAGISFAVKTEFQKKTNILFERKGSEDFNFLNSFVKKGYDFKISDYVAYEVCRDNTDKQK